MPTNIANCRFAVVASGEEAILARELALGLGFSHVTGSSSVLELGFGIKDKAPEIVLINLYCWLQSLEHISSADIFKDTHFIVITPKLSADELRDITGRGATHILERPFSSSELMEKILDFRI